MTTLTIALIAKNEAANLTDCLASCAGLADQIVVVDSGSTDDTVAIAEQFGAKVIVHTLWQGFGPQRQVAQSHVTGDWVLWLDADERLTPALKVAIREAITLDDRQCLYQVNRLSWVFGRFIRHSGWYPDRVVRLYATKKTSYTKAPVHEQVAKGSLAGILGYETRPLVSVDYAQDTRSAIIDALSTMVTDGTMLKVYAWYDNEMGYACRMVDLACHLETVGI